eukprot:200609-Lingulodinium_polyedra.AAC.1
MRGPSSRGPAVFTASARRRWVSGWFSTISAPGFRSHLRETDVIADPFAFGGLAVPPAGVSVSTGLWTGMPPGAGVSARRGPSSWSIRRSTSLGSSSSPSGGGFS